jgi:hypothetical protein
MSRSSPGGRSCRSRILTETDGQCSKCLIMPSGKPANIAASGSEQSGSGSRAAVLRRREPTRFPSASDDEVGGNQARSARSEPSERSNQTPLTSHKSATRLAKEG